MAPSKPPPGGAPTGWWPLAKRNPYLLGVFMLSSMMDSLPMTAMGLLLNKELGLAATPEKITAFYALEMLPFLFKSVYGSLSDLVPVGGYRRRPYVALGCCVGALHNIVLAGWVQTYQQLCVVSVMKSVFASVAETGADGALVELAGGDPYAAASLQSAGMATRTIGSFIAVLLSTWALTVMKPRAVIASAAVFGMGAAVCGMLVMERRQPPACGGEGGRCPPASAKACLTEASSWWGLTRTARTQLLPVALFMLAVNATPSSAAYESYVYTAFHATDWQLSLQTFLGQLGSLAGIALYWASCTRVDVRVAMAATTVLSCLSGLTRLLFAMPSALTTVPPALVLPCLLADNFVLALLGRLAFMPLLAMAAQYAPPRLEAVTFAALTTCLDLGTELGQLSTAALTASLSVGAPPQRSWDRLPTLVVVGSLSKVVVLPLLLWVKPLLPAVASGVSLDDIGGDHWRGSALEAPLLFDETEWEDASEVGPEESPAVLSTPPHPRGVRLAAEV